MADKSDGQILYLPLAQPSDHPVVDLSAMRHVVQPLGAPTFESDAQIGGVMIFGRGNGIEVPALHLEAGKDTPHSIQAWFRVDGLPSQRGWPLCLGQSGPGAHHWLINPDGRLQLGAWNGPQIVPVIATGAWAHVAVTFDGGRLRAYIDGQPQGEAISSSFNFESTWLTLGKDRWGGEADFSGRLAQLRIHDRALSVEEVASYHKADSLSQRGFVDSHPLEIQLADHNGDPRLHITGNKPGRPLRVTLTNVAATPVKFRKRDGAASPSNFHFELRFRPDTLNLDDIHARTAVTPADLWSVAPHVHANKTVSLFFLNKKDGRTIGPHQSMMLTLPEVKAGEKNGAHNTRVEMRYGDVHIETNPDSPIAGQRIVHMAVRHLQHRLPVHIGFHGRTNVVPSVGKTRRNTLILRLTNTSRDDPIRWNPGNFKGASALAVGFDYQLNGEDRPFALCDLDSANGIDVSAQTEFRRLGTTDGRLQIVAWRKEDGSQSDAYWQVTLEAPPMETIPPNGLIFIRREGTQEYTPVSVDLVRGEDRRELLFRAQPPFKDGQRTELLFQRGDWQVHDPEPLSQNPKWRITSERVREIPPGGSLEIGIANIVSDLPPGPTNLYLEYENIPGYGEGEWTVAFAKSPLDEFGHKRRQGEAGILVESSLTIAASGERSLILEGNEVRASEKGFSNLNLLPEGGTVLIGQRSAAGGGPANLRIGDIDHGELLVMNEKDQVILQTTGDRRPLTINREGNDVIIGNYVPPWRQYTRVGISVEEATAPLDAGGGFMVLRGGRPMFLNEITDFFRQNYGKLNVGDMVIVPPDAEHMEVRLYWVGVYQPGQSTAFAIYGTTLKGERLTGPLTDFWQTV